MKKIVVSAAVAVLTVLGARAGTWYFGKYGSTKDNYIWYVEGDTTNWVIRTAVVSGNDLAINQHTAGSGGDLDLSTFTSDVGDGKRIVSITGRMFEAGYCKGTITSINAPDVVEIGSRAFYSAPGLQGVVSFPSVRKIFNLAFNGCSSVKEFRFPSVTNILDSPFSGCSSVTNIVLSSGLMEMGNSVILGCTALENLSPHVFPVLTKCGLINSANQRLPNFVLYMDAPELVSIGASFLRGKNTIGLFRAPKLKAINGYDFSEVTFLPGAGDLDFPGLETLGGRAFQAAGVTSFRAPKLASVPDAFYNCPSLTNVVLSQTCKSLASSAFYDCPNLASFDPLLPSDMTSISSGTFGGAGVHGAAYALPAGSVWPQPFVWDNAAIAAIPSGLCYSFPLTNLTFLTQVDSIGANAFRTLAPRADIHFYGTAPTFENASLYRTNAEANNERPVIHIHTSSTLASWQAAAAPNAELFATYKDKPDCPAEAIGLITLKDKVGRNPVYAYLVNDAAVAGTGYLTLEGVPVPIGTVDPAYGTQSEIAHGTKFTCTAPSVVSATDVRAGLAGYVVSNVTATGEITFRAEGDTNSYAYEQLEDSARLTWIWTNVQYRVVAAANGHGSVSAAEQWTLLGESATVMALPEAGYVFRYWTGDCVEEIQKYSPTLTIPVDGPKSVTAVFTEPVTYAWSYDSTSNPKKISYNSSDGQETRWVFTVTESSGKLTLSTYVSGVGELDLRSFASDLHGEKTIVGVAKALNGNTKVTAVFLPESVDAIPTDAFNGCAALRTIEAPGVRTIGLRGLRATGLQGTVSFPAVLNVGESSFQASTVQELRFASVTNVANGAFDGAGSLTNAVFSEDLEAIGWNAFKDCRSLQAIRPAYLPKLKTISTLWWKQGAVPTNFVVDLDVPVLETLGGYAFYTSAGVTVRRFDAPRLRTLGEYAFGNTRFAAGDGDLDFPAVEEAGVDAFSGSQLTSIRVPKLACITNEVFRNCSQLTNAVITSARRIHAAAFANNSATRLRLEPFLPTNMTYVTFDSFGTGRFFANEEFVWDNPEMPVVPKALALNTQLSRVIFKSDVTHVTTNAFQSLVSRAVVEFRGPTAPELVKLPFYYNGETNDDRIRIYVCNKDALEGWRAKVAPNDELYRTDFKRKKPDWPGRRTLGILELSGTKYDGKTVTTSYAWVVNGTEPPGLTIRIR